LGAFEVEGLDQRANHGAVGQKAGVSDAGGFVGAAGGASDVVVNLDEGDAAAGGGEAEFEADGARDEIVTPRDRQSFGRSESGQRNGGKLIAGGDVQGGGRFGVVEPGDGGAEAADPAELAAEAFCASGVLDGFERGLEGLGRLAGGEAVAGEPCAEAGNIVRYLTVSPGRWIKRIKSGDHGERVELKLRRAILDGSLVNAIVDDFADLLGKGETGGGDGTGNGVVRAGEVGEGKAEDNLGTPVCDFLGSAPSQE